MSCHTLHNDLFRAAFSRQDNAVGELRAVLRPELVKRITWTTLRIDEGYFVDAQVKDRYADVLYSVQFGEGGSSIIGASPNGEIVGEQAVRAVQEGVGRSAER